ncbi:GtrA family protein [Persephonella sp. KM09-Lau-8]|uniref:GtrA family protein n=1 Tax=Persephonella sp. KM09-Lau-8 TaxID=1158345 RepID=UPI000496E7E8|nr:GtrA family protein [Persephonella sp. KM09-Lau-8]
MDYRKVSRFIFIGGLAFLVDYFIFKFLHPYVGVSARIISFLTAAFFSWSLNRRFTFEFQERNIFMEFVKYLSSSKIAYVTNVSIFYVFFSVVGMKALFSYIVATGFSALVSYNLYRRI